MKCWIETRRPPQVLMAGGVFDGVLLMIGVLSILCASALVTATFLFFQAIGGRALGAQVEEVSFFFGRVFSFRAAHIRWSVGFLPTGGSVGFSDEFQALHPGRKIAIACCGLFSYALVAIIGLGFNGALHHVATGYGQLLRGTMSPLQDGAKLVAALMSVFGSGSYLSGLGILAAKFFAWNSLPLGALTGGFIVMCLLEMAGLKSEGLNVFQWLGYLVVLLVSVAWAVALLGALGRAL